MTDMKTNAEMIGREEVNDLEAILSVTTPDDGTLVAAVESEFDTIFTWDYEKGSRPKLNRLYEKAKTSMWNAETDLDWSIDVDQEEVVRNNALMNPTLTNANADMTGTPFEKWGDKEWLEVGIESQNWMLSQFLHGEQGALVCTARIVESVPWIDAKYYAATQVMDEARHVAFGVLSLQDHYKELTQAELHERQEFAFEAAVRMRDRFLQQEVWERMGVPVKDAVELVRMAPEREMFQQMLFSKIVPNCKKLGLLDAGDGWLRTKFGELGVIQFEHWADTGEEYEMFALANGETSAA